MDKVEDKTAGNSAGDELEAAAPAPAAATVEEGGGGHVSSPAKEEVQGYRPGMEEGILHYMRTNRNSTIHAITHVSVDIVTLAGWGHNRLRTCAFLSVFLPS